jgi:hypothetical protein
MKKKLHRSYLPNGKRNHNAEIGLKRSDLLDFERRQRERDELLAGNLDYSISEQRETLLHHFHEFARILLKLLFVILAALVVLILK